MKFCVGVLYENLSRQLEFPERLAGDSRILLKGVDKFVSQTFHIY